MVINKLTFFGMAAALAIQIFIFVPIVLYLGNLDEINISIGTMIKLCMIPTLILLLVIEVTGVFGSTKFKQIFIVLVSIINILVWFQGNILLWDYGLLDGQSIDWTKNVWRGWIDTSIWICAIAIGLFYWHRIGKQVIRLSLAVFILQFITVLYLSFENRTDILKKTSADQDTHSALEKIYEFSIDNNVLHIILDGFQSDVFQDLLDDASIGKMYRSQFDGFVFYKETMGNFPYTRFAVPAFLSGKLYSNEMMQDDFVDAVLRGKNILNVATAKGYEVDIGAGLHYLEKRLANTDHQNIYGLNNIDSSDEKVAQLIDLSLFRVAPHFIRPHIYNTQKWLLSSYFSKDDGMQFNFFKHKYFLDNLIKNMNTARKKPVYKYFHIMNTHKPMVVNNKCEYAGRVMDINRETLTVQSKCTIDILIRLFERMKELGIYDNTLIVLHGDHGGLVPNHRSGQPIVFKDGSVAPDWIASLASPMLSIKPPGASGDLQVSSLLVSLTDLPDTISDMLNWNVDFGHKSILKINPDETRERRFRIYAFRKNEWTSDYAGPIYEFIIKGSHYENKWKLGPEYQPPN